MGWGDLIQSLKQQDKRRKKKYGKDYYKKRVKGNSDVQ